MWTESELAVRTAQKSDSLHKESYALDITELIWYGKYFSLFGWIPMSMACGIHIVLWPKSVNTESVEGHSKLIF